MFSEFTVQLEETGFSQWDLTQKAASDKAAVYVRLLGAIICLMTQPVSNTKLGVSEGVKSGKIRRYSPLICRDKGSGAYEWAPEPYFLAKRKEKKEKREKKMGLNLIFGEKAL